MRVVPFSIGLWCAAMLAAAALSGCAATDASLAERAAPSGPQAEWPENSAAYASLLALREAERPAASPQEVPELRGLDGDLLRPLTDDDPEVARARLPLAEVLATVRAAGSDSPGRTPSPPTEAALVRAQRLYASGVARLTAGDNPGAARDLAAAAQLDPGAPSPWLRLAEAQARMGQGPASLLSRKRAVDLGSEHAISLAILGMQSGRTGQSDLAAHYLARCLDADPRRIDPLLRQVALVRIADPLRQLGYLRASIEALRDGLVLPRELTAPTRFGDEATDIARRTSDSWVQIGDTACRLGDDPLAAEAYATAAAAPSVDPGAILARQAYVLLRSGRYASVGLLVLDDIGRRAGRASARDLGLLALLREREDVGPLVAGALADLAASLPDSDSASAPASLVLARAGAAPRRQAEALLLDRARAVPGERRIVEALFALPGDDTTREELALRLVGRAPDDAELITSSLLAWHAHPATLLGSLPDSPVGLLVRLHVLRGFGMTAQAAALDPRTEGLADRSLAFALAEAWGLAAASAGAWDVVDRAIALLAESPAGAARVCRAAQRYEPGRAALDSLADEQMPLPVLLLASEVSLGVGELERAERLLQRARDLDPYDERPYEGLTNVYQAMGDQQRAAETIRELRVRVPSSYLLRWVNAQEEAGRGLLDQAERSLRELAEDAPGNGSALGMLSQIWGQRASVGDTESLEGAARWLAARADRRPVSPEIIAAHGRVLALLGRGEEAEGVLRDGLAARPSPAISRTLEGVLRAGGRAAEADALAAARFADAGAGIEPGLERAEFLARANRWAEVTPLVRGALPDGAVLTAVQRGRVLSLISAMASRAEQPETPTARADAISLIHVAREHGIDLPWQLRYSLWALLSTAPEATDSQIVDATESFLDAIDSIELANTVIGDTASRLLIPVQTLEQARGHVAYQLAGALSNTGRTSAALAVYRTALSHYPDHPWAANDLGYFLVERDEDLAEAEELLERAFAIKPDQSNIADSLGWLRYKLGQLVDETLPDGSTRAGAISLLITASGLPGGSESATIHDHLGDALWRAGDRERARAVWIRAQQLLVDELVQLRDGGSSPRRTRLVEEQTRVGGKLDAVQAGAEPQTAPLIDR